MRFSFVILYGVYTGISVRFSNVILYGVYTSISVRFCRFLMLFCTVFIPVFLSGFAVFVPSLPPLLFLDFCLI